MRNKPDQPTIAIRSWLAIVGVPTLCLLWHYYGYVFDAFSK